MTARLIPKTPNTGAMAASGLNGACEYPTASQGKPVKIQSRTHSEITHNKGAAIKTLGLRLLK